MKTLLITLMILSMGILCYAQDFSTINNESIKAFTQLMSEYKALIESFNNETTPSESALNANQYASETQALFKKYGITMDQFSVFMQKVNIGFATIQMQKMGTEDSMGSVIESIKSQLGNNDITDEELNVLRMNEEEIQVIFND